MCTSVIPVAFPVENFSASVVPVIFGTVSLSCRARLTSCLSAATSSTQLT